MSPKRKACAEVSGNTSQATYVPRPDSLPKGQQYQAKSRAEETVSLVQVPADKSLARELSGTTTHEKLHYQMVVYMIHFLLFLLFFTPEIFEELAGNTNLYAFQKREMVAHAKGMWQGVQKSVSSRLRTEVTQHDWRGFIENWLFLCTGTSSTYKLAPDFQKATSAILPVESPTYLALPYT
ncbi:hypothetical protein HOY82DRAFT_613551 [Tuber indicum]|nr:hypothetical protein HOY82DRAFT_613551 [Tuber indicum]